MPSICSTDSRAAVVATGTLYVVATPIGNRQDITLRALEVLKRADLVAAEDTRKTARLLAHFGLTTPLVSYHEHNESTRTPDLLRRLQQGVTIALVTNAGTPGVSDPGYRLVSAAADAGLRVVPVPGVTAATAALSASGLATDAFVFQGFLPKKAGRRRRQIKALASETRTVIVYESPQRIVALIGELMAAFGDRRCVLAREMTKLHEEFIRGRLSELLAVLKARGEVKGECTLLVAGRTETEPSSRDAAREDLRRALTSGSRGLSELAREVAHGHGLPRQAVYAEAMKIKAQLAESENGNDPVSIPDE
jgi:16S rRNA (cytidine1402-2'-O)-methyltransferase